MADVEPLRLSVSTSEPSALFEEGTFPYRGPVLKESVAQYLLLRTRQHRTTPDVEVDFRFAGPLGSEEKAGFERDLRAYYEVAAEEAHTELRVNTVEARRTFFLGLLGSVIALAIAIPLRLYLGFDFYIIEFLCVVVVWILMWDSIEMLLWDSMLIRMRRNALRKLKDAAIRYSSPGAGEPAPAAP